MNHYFSEKPEIKSEKKIIKYTIQNKKFEFITDNGFQNQRLILELI